MPPFTAQDVADQCMLQLMFKHKCMLESTAQDVCAQIYGDSSEENYLASLSRVGKLLEDLKMQIKTVRHFNDQNKYIALINQAEDEPAKLSSKYTFAEMQFFYILIEQIATQEDAEDGACWLGVNDALNLSTATPPHMTQFTQAQGDAPAEPTRLSISAKEEALERLIADWWLLQDDSGRLSIGPRTFLELRQYLLELNLSDETKQVWDAAL